MKRTLDPTFTDAVLAALGERNRALAAAYPGASTRRQPLHTVYGGAHLFRAETPHKLGRIARDMLATYAPDPGVLADVLGLPGAGTLPPPGPARDALLRRAAEDPSATKPSAFGAWLAHTVYERVRDKLAREPVEDLRIDFEDGFGIRSDDEEDGAAVGAAEETARALADGALPPLLGIRIKALTEETKRRALRTLDLYLTALLDQTGGLLPDPFVITLPKVQSTCQVSALADVLDRFEERAGISPGTLGVELMIETPQALLDREGRCPLPRLAQAARGRCTGAHFGTYDYTAACNVTAAHQTMDHPACDFAKHLMAVAFAGTGIALSDGATTAMPVPPHRGSDLDAGQRAENRRVVHDAWRTMYRDVRRSLVGGFYQGWDLHPGQLPVRYAACFAFFLEGLDPATERLRNFIAAATRATRVGDVFDDAATGQGLLNTFLWAYNGGAITLDEVLATGLTLEEVQGRSFAQVVANRSAGGPR